MHGGTTGTWTAWFLPPGPCHDEGMPDDGRELDLVLFGATGFTGALTADYLAEHGPAGLRWALAGRSLDKLEKERDRLGLPELELVVADSADPTSLADLARRTKVVITT